MDRVRTGEWVEGSKIWDVSRYTLLDSTTCLLTLLFQDTKPEDIKAIDINQFHRKVDFACVTRAIFVQVTQFPIRRILEAGKSNKFIGYIIAPSHVYGVPRENPWKKISDMIPTLVRLSVQRRRAIYAGKGESSLVCFV